LKWINHELISGAIMFSISSGNIIDTSFVLAGSVFPDWIEGRPTESNYNTWRKYHRGASHWLLMYCVLFILSGLYITHTSSVLPRYMAIFTFGAILHIIEDLLCGKVPVISLKNKIGFKLFTVGSIEEYALSFVLVYFVYLTMYE